MENGNRETSDSKNSQENGITTNGTIENGIDKKITRSSTIESDANPLTGNPSYGENKTKNEEKQDECEEEIEVNSSPELICDEYHNKNAEERIRKHGILNVDVHIFYDIEDPSGVTAKDLVVSECENVGIKIDPGNIHDTISHGSVAAALKRISKSKVLTEVDGLLIIYLANIINADEFITRDEHFVTTKNVWFNFTYNECRALEKKPKMFIFLPLLKHSRVQTDGVPPQQSFINYDVPSEADMLIIYMKCTKEDQRKNFITEFLKLVESNGKRDDVVTLIARMESNPRPITVSTLTRKIFLQFCAYRGYHYDLHASDIEVQNKMNELKAILQKRKDEELLQQKEQAERKVLKQGGTLKKSLDRKSSTIKKISKSVEADSVFNSKQKEQQERKEPKEGGTLKIGKERKTSTIRKISKGVAADSDKKTSPVTKLIWKW